MNPRSSRSLLLAASALCAPAIAQNDECSGAIALTAGVATSFDTTTATPSAGAWSCVQNGGPDLWFSYTVTAASTLTVATCGSSYDTVLEVHSGPCTSLVSVECNDDACGTQSELQIAGALAGEVYLIRVGGWTGAAGAGTITVTEAARPLPTGSMSAWLDAVGSGLAPSYVNSGFIGPIEADIGPTNGAAGVSYEFVVYGDNAGASTGLLGSRDGAASGLKFEQWSNSEQYGVTNFGIADHYFSTQNNTPNEDVHLVFVADTSNATTELFENGVSLGTVPSAPVLFGLMGIGKIHGSAGDVDVMDTGQVFGVAVYEGKLTAQEIIEHHDAYFFGNLGTNYCTPNPNSTGVPGVVEASGSRLVSSNTFSLTAKALPPRQFGIFLAAPIQGFVPGAGGTSNGNLCLSGAIGQFIQAGQIRNSGGAGEFTIQVPLTQIPQPGGFVSVLPGDTWNFQAWHRDTVGLGSNFTNGVEVEFL